MLLIFRSLVLAGCFGLFWSSHALGEPLVLVGKPSIEAEFVSADGAGMLTFRVEDVARGVPLSQLVSWSTVRLNAKRGEIHLVDGTRLVLADSWTDNPSWELNEQSVHALTRTFGKVTLSRKLVQAILINAPQGLVRRSNFIDRQVTLKDSAASLLLINGDRWDGQHIKTSKKSDSKYLAAMTSGLGQRMLETTIDQLAAMVLAAPHDEKRISSKLWAGTRDGSLLSAESLSASESQLRVRLTCGIDLRAKKSNQLSYLRSAQAPIEYLSERQDIAYRHEPYLDLSSSFQRDRNVLSSPLQAKGKIYAKGIGVTTAARLSFELEPGKYQRFVARAAIDTAAEQQGSVIFRVYLRSDEAWELAFESPTVRGGDEPLSVVVELEDTTQLALVTDFADRGDELDYANWLDARLE